MDLHIIRNNYLQNVFKEKQDCYTSQINFTVIFYTYIEYVTQFY